MKRIRIGLFILMGIMSAHAEETYLGSASYNIPGEVDNEFSKAPYDEKRFELGYQAFIYSGRVQDAFSLVKQAVQAQPDSQVWKARLIQTALWSNHSYDALQGMQEFVFTQGNATYFPAAVKLANQLKAFDVLEKLLEYQHAHVKKTKDSVLQLAKVYHDQDKTLKGIQLLKSENQRAPDKQFLLTTADFYHDEHNFDQEKKAWLAYSKHYGWDAKSALRLAQMNYTKGDLRAAFNDLRAVPEKSVWQDADFWHTKTNLAWTLSEIPTAIRGYWHLFSIEKMSDEDARRFFEILKDKQSALAMKVGLYRVQHFPSEMAFFNLLDFASNQNAVSVKYQLYHLPIDWDLKSKLMKSPEYFQGAASLWLALSDGHRAQQVMLESLTWVPEKELAISNYLSWITEQTSRVNAQPYPGSLSQALKNPIWQKLAAIDLTALYPYAYGLLLTDRTNQAATLYSHYLMPVLPWRSEKKYETQNQEIRQFKNITWGARYADVLERARFWKSAYRVQQYLWQEMQKTFSMHQSDQAWIEIYRELALQFAPVSIAYPYILMSVQQDGNASSQDALMAWAINRNQVILADQVVHRISTVPLPLWAAARLAMWHEDKPMMQKLLEQYKETLPRKEAVNMALELDARPLAQQHSYQALSQDHRDAERYEFFKESFLPVADEAGLNQEYVQYGNLQGFREKFHAKIFFKNRYYLSPYMTWWQMKTNDAEQLASLSYNQKQMGLRLGEWTKRYQWEVDGGENLALYSHPYLIAKGSYQLLGQWRVGARAAYQETSELNNYMQVAGNQDQLQGQVQYQMTQRDTILSTLSYNQFHLQDRTSLGKSLELENTVEHKFFFSYPDYKMILSVGAHKFSQENKLLTGDVTRIFPENTEPNANIFMPNTYFDYGLAFGFGENLLEDYTQAWRPFAEVGTNYASTAGFGYNLLAGISGSVWGRDKLVFYYMQSENTQGASQKNYVYGIGYKMYF